MKANQENKNNQPVVLEKSSYVESVGNIDTHIRHPEYGGATHLASKETNVIIPANAQIVAINVYLKNRDSRNEGESYYQPTEFTKAPLNGWQNEHGEWGGGWAKVNLIAAEHSAYYNNQIVVTVQFINWKDDNSRSGQLSVQYTLPSAN
jgi:hypothetical protein